MLHHPPSTEVLPEVQTKPPVAFLAALLAHIQPGAHQDPQALFLRAAAQPGGSQDGLGLFFPRGKTLLCTSWWTSQGSCQLDEVPLDQRVPLVGQPRLPALSSANWSSVFGFHWRTNIWSLIISSFACSHEISCQNFSFRKKDYVIGK